MLTIFCCSLSITIISPSTAVFLSEKQNSREGWSVVSEVGVPITTWLQASLLISIFEMKVRRCTSCAILQMSAEARLITLSRHISRFEFQITSATPCTLAASRNRCGVSLFFNSDSSTFGERVKRREWLLRFLLPSTESTVKLFFS